MKPIAFLKSFNWGKEDVKKILIFIIMLLIACFILNNFLLVRIRIIQRHRGFFGRESISVDVDGSVDADVSGNIDTTVVDFLDDIRIRQ